MFENIQKKLEIVRKYKETVRNWWKIEKGVNY